MSQPKPKQYKALKAHRDACDGFKWYFDRFGSMNFGHPKRQSLFNMKFTDYVISKWKVCPYCGDKLK